MFFSKTRKIYTEKFRYTWASPLSSAVHCVSDLRINQTSALAEIPAPPREQHPPGIIKTAL